MAAMGYKTFHWMPKSLTLTPNMIYPLAAQNEYLYIFDVNSQAGDVFTIRADNDIIKQSDFILSGVPYLFYEVTGNVTINTVNAINDQTFLYIRVLPEEVITQN